MTDKEKQEFKEKILNKVLYRAKEHVNKARTATEEYIDEETLSKICYADMLQNYEREEQGQGAKVLLEVKLRARERIGGFPIDENILEDICDSIRVDKNI